MEVDSPAGANEGPQVGRLHRALSCAAIIP